jgi:hypothetical protein
MITDDATPFQLGRSTAVPLLCRLIPDDLQAEDTSDLIDGIQRQATLAADEPG